MPKVQVCAFAGKLMWRSTDALFVRHPSTAAEIFIDIMSDRGFGVAHEVVKTPVPVSVNIDNSLSIKWWETQVFDIRFEPALLRSRDGLAEELDRGFEAPPAAQHSAAAVQRHLQRRRPVANPVAGEEANLMESLVFDAERVEQAGNKPSSRGEEVGEQPTRETSRTQWDEVFGYAASDKQ